jgi:hypothetical protein
MTRHHYAQLLLVMSLVLLGGLVGYLAGAIVAEAFMHGAFPL